MKVRFIGNKQNINSRLTVGKAYEVLGIEADTYRVINDESDPCLYEPNLFEIIDSNEPEFWTSELGEDNERYAYPRTWIKTGFFEDYHDGVGTVIKQFWNDCEILYGITKK